MQSRIFKFFPPERIDVLENLKIRFTPPFELNDPFECVARMAVPTDEELRRQHHDAMRKIWELQPILYPEKALPSFQEFMRLAKAHPEEWLNELKSHYEELVDIFPRKLQHDLGNRLGILCLTENYESLLMWAHYTKGHSGFVIEFDFNHPFINNPDHRIVKYGTERPIYNPRDTGQFPFDPILTTKSSEWAYEKEHRIVKNVDRLESRAIDGKVMFFADVPPLAIKTVYVGCKMLGKNIRRLHSILMKEDFAHAQMFVMLPDRERFRMLALGPNQIGAPSPAVEELLKERFVK